MQAIYAGLLTREKHNCAQRNIYAIKLPQFPVLFRKTKMQDRHSQVII